MIYSTQGISITNSIPLKNKTKLPCYVQNLMSLTDELDLHRSGSFSIRTIGLYSMIPVKESHHSMCQCWTVWLRKFQAWSGSTSPPASEGVRW